MNQTKPTKRLYEVEVTYRIFVTADTEESAEDWTENNVTEWSSDPPENVHAQEMLHRIAKDVPEDVQASLPWAADGLSDEESDKPIRWWLDRTK